MSEIVGYQLIKIADGSVVNQWGGIWGQCPGLPNPVIIPDVVHIWAPALGEIYEGYRLETWEMEPPAPTTENVNAERDRRTNSGFEFQNNRFQSRPEDRENVAGAGTLAAIAIMNGAQPGDLRWHGGESDFVWIAEDNALVPMDAQTVIEFGKALAAWKSSHIFAARELKDVSPIPSDYNDNKYWPQ